MKINKYLKELGYNWYDLPGNYRKELKDNNKLCNSPAADPRSKINETGFSVYEFFSLDHTLALYIYPRLCYFRDNIMDMATPGCFCSMGTNKEASKLGHEIWKEKVNKMCEAFRLLLDKNTQDGYESINQQKINEGLHLFAEYFQCLWY